MSLRFWWKNLTPTGFKFCRHLNNNQQSMKPLQESVWSSIKSAGILKPMRGKRGGKLLHRLNHQRSLIAAPNSSSSMKVVSKTNVNGPERSEQPNLNIQHPSSSIIHSTSSCKLMNICLLNARSINNKTLTIKDYLVDSKADAMALTETWLKSNDESTFAIRDICPSGYCVLHKPRQTGCGGGVALIYKNNLKFELVKSDSFKSFEHMEFLLHSSILTRLLIVYRPPPSTSNGLSNTMFFQEFPSLLESTVINSGKLLMMGDFNYHVDDPSDVYAMRFIDLLDTFNLQQHISKPTHNHNHTLDLVISRKDEGIIADTNVEDPVISDHCVVHCNLNVLTKPQVPKVEKIYRKLRAVNKDDFCSDVLKSSLISSPASSLDKLCEQYHSELSHLVDAHAPLRKRLVSSRPVSPWYTEEISSEKRKRRQLERRWRKSQMFIDRQLYTEQCTVVKELIKSSKMMYYSTLIDDNKSDHKALFRIIDSLLHRKPEKLYPSCNSPADLCNKFADFFTDKINGIKSQFDTNGNESSIFNVLDNADLNCKLTNFSPTTEEELSSLIVKCASKSCSLDPVPSALRPSCLSVMLPVITKIVNLSIETCEVPATLKTAVLSPLLKKPSLDHEMLANFRPVSNLKFISKVIEKVVSVRLKNYLNDNNLNEPMQSAYKKRHSVETALIRVKNDILRAIDNRRCVVLLLLDLSAAFDTVDHNILLGRMSSKFGIRGNALAWFRSYLAERTQYVEISGSVSSTRPLDCGVPQGSVLGPILYLIYTSPLGDILRKHCMSFHLYADDTQLYTTFVYNDDNHLASTKISIENCLLEIDHWMTCNKLKLNKDKTELLILHSRFHSGPTLPSAITLGTDEIHPSNHARNIGVIFDSTLSMTNHVNCIVKSAFYHLRNIARIRKFLSYDTTKLLIHAFVSSKLDNCNSLLYGLPKYTIQKLQNVQNAAARVIARLRKHDHITPTLIELHWLPIDKRIEFKILLITFTALNNTAPIYISDLVEPYRPARPLRSSKLSRLKPVAFNLKNYGYRAFSVAAPQLWNAIPEDIKSSSSVEIFKSRLKTFLFKLSYNL